ncbi:MAG: hypothetical protein ACRD0L_14710 [Acidimicrobiales bacterium]
MRFPTAGEVLEPIPPVPTVGPVVFTLRFRGIERAFDCSDLPCPKLVRPLASALASIGGDEATVRTLSPDFAQMVRHLGELIRFVDAHAGAGAGGAERFGLGDLSPAILDAFEADLVARYGTMGKRVQVFMATAVRLLRLAGEADPEALSAPMQARLGYSTTLARHYGTPLDAYPIPVLEATQQAALGDVRAIRERIDAGRARAATGADPAGAGWSARENALWHLTHHGPLPPEQFRALHKLRCAPGGIGALNAEVFLTTADLVAFLVALICSSGLEPDCAKGLRAECLSSPSGGFVTLGYQKRRAHARTAKAMRVRDGGLMTPGGLIRLATRLTDPARQAISTDALWVGVGDGGLRAFFDTGYEMTHQVQVWAGRHRLADLVDRDGQGVRLDLRRLRKTVKSAAYLRSGGVLDDFATGHTKQVAASRYADIDAHAELHDQAVEAGLRQALETALSPPVVATGAGTALPVPGATALPLNSAQAQAAATAAQDVFLAACSGFYDSPFARSPGAACPVAVWGCLECPNAVFTERHLPSLTSFARFLDDQRDELAGPEWRARYGLAHDRLTTGVLPAFSPDQLGQAGAPSAADAASSLPARLLEALA